MPTATASERYHHCRNEVSAKLESQLATQTGTGRETMSTGMEPLRRTIHQIPGIIYEPLARRAIIVGSGLEVFEIVLAYEAARYDWAELRDAFHWLSEKQLRAALDFYEANKAEVEERLEVERSFDIERFWQQYPETKPPHRR